MVMQIRIYLPYNKMPTGFPLSFLEGTLFLLSASSHQAPQTQSSPSASVLQGNQQPDQERAQHNSGLLPDFHQAELSFLLILGPIGQGRIFLVVYPTQSTLLTLFKKLCKTLPTRTHQLVWSLAFPYGVFSTSHWVCDSLSEHLLFTFCV